MIEISIGLLGKPPEMVKGSGLLDGECPLATQDEIINKGNKQKAILIAEYGPSDQEQKCGNCAYGEKMEGCGVKNTERFCEIFEFVCSAKNVCNCWESYDEDEEK